VAEVTFELRDLKSGLGKANIGILRKDISRAV
jgi:hypothetical protein